MEQITGVEPACPAWEAGVLPMNYICMIPVYHIAEKSQEKEGVLFSTCFYENRVASKENWKKPLTSVGNFAILYKRVR